MVRVKVCGIKRVEDALLAVELGAEMIGLNFSTISPRRVELAQAKKIVQQIKEKAEIVGVFVNQTVDEIAEIAQEIELNWIQLHGDEPPDYCAQFAIKVIKALRLGSDADLQNLDLYRNVLWLIDSKTEKYGGSGVSPDWTLAKKAKEKVGKIILAGGLNSENVARAIKEVKPWAVDVASGIESSPGLKDEKKLKDFFKAIKDASG